MFHKSIFNQDVSNWINKLSKKCSMQNFGILNNIEINSYDDFKYYHRQIILNKF